MLTTPSRDALQRISIAASAEFCAGSAAQLSGNVRMIEQIACALVGSTLCCRIDVDDSVFGGRQQLCQHRLDRRRALALLGIVGIESEIVELELEHGNVSIAGARHSGAVRDRRRKNQAHQHRGKRPHAVTLYRIRHPP